MTGEECQLDKNPELRGRKELTTGQVAKLANTGRNWLGDLGRRVPANMNCYHDGFALLSLRGAKRRSNLGGAANEIAAPRQAGARNDKRERNEIAARSTQCHECPARNDKRAWWWRKEAAMKSWRTDLDSQVCSLFLGFMTRMTISACGALSTERAGRSWAMNDTSNVILHA